jgi:G3E family GTPase
MSARTQEESPWETKGFLLVKVMGYNKASLIEKKGYAMKVVPIYLLSGFLGSGKTTLLKTIVEQAQRAGLTPAILMNELGEVNLDGQLVSKEVAMAEVLGGCICCSMRGDLSLELNGLLQKYEPDLVIVESTGAAHPLESIDAITETSMYKQVKLQQVITVVDSEHMLARAKTAKDKTYRLMQEQIRCATIIILNKCDRLHPEQIVELQQLVRELNGYAEMITTSYAKLEDWSWLVQIQSDEADHNHPIHSHELNHDDSHDHNHNHSHDHNHNHNHEHSHEHQHSDHHSHVMAYTHYWQSSPHSEEFEAWLAALPANIYRAKGIVTFRDLPSRYLFQFAYRESDFMRIEPQGDVHDVAVFIGEHFDSAWLQEELARLELSARS